MSDKYTIYFSDLLLFVRVNITVMEEHHKSQQICLKCERCQLSIKLMRGAEILQNLSAFKQSS